MAKATITKKQGKVLNMNAYNIVWNKINPN